MKSVSSPPQFRLPWYFAISIYATYAVQVGQAIITLASLQRSDVSLLCDTGYWQTDNFNCGEYTYILDKGRGIEVLIS